MSWRKMNANPGEYSSFLEEANALTEEGQGKEQALRALVNEAKKTLEALDNGADPHVNTEANAEENERILRRISERISELKALKEKIDGMKSELERLRREIQVLRGIDAEYDENLRDENWMQKNAKGE